MEGIQIINCNLLPEISKGIQNLKINPDISTFCITTQVPESERNRTQVSAAPV